MRRSAFAILTLALGVQLVAAPGAGAKRALLTGFGEPAYQTVDDAARDLWFDETVEANAGIVRIDVSWRQVVAQRPANPRNPADPAYDFSRIDDAVREAAERGLTVVLTIQQAPGWAEGPNAPRAPPAHAPGGTWKPDPDDLGDLGSALATRYSGVFPGLRGLAALPEVRYFEVWNEPNISLFLNPQWDGFKPVAAVHYRKMLNAFYESVKAANPDAKVIAGSTAPFGSDPPNSLRIRPLRFMRTLLCLKGNLEQKRCSKRAKFDIYAHHPINIYGGPRSHLAEDPDDVNAAIEFDEVRRTLRAAERQGTVRPKGHRPLWATEIWWESDPPDSHYGHPLEQQARWLEEAFYLLWKYDVQAVIWLQLVDTPLGKEGFENLQAGVLFDDARRKPAFQAFQFPFVTERQSRKRVLAWGKSPASGPLEIERKAGGEWRHMKTLDVQEGEVFTKRLRRRGKAELRASVAGQESLAWKQGK